MKFYVYSLIPRSNLDHPGQNTSKFMFFRFYIKNRVQKLRSNACNLASGSYREVRGDYRKHFLQFSSQMLHRKPQTCQKLIIVVILFHLFSKTSGLKNYGLSLSNKSLIGIGSSGRLKGRFPPMLVQNAWRGSEL